MVLRSAPKSDINRSVCFTVVVFAAYNLPVTKANIHLCPKPSIRKSSGPQTISAHSCCFRAGKIQIKIQENGLPNTFVPGRNLMFMTIAAAIAYRRGLKVLVGGMCETDFSG